MNGPVVCHLGRTRQKREAGTPTGVKREAAEDIEEDEEGGGGGGPARRSGGRSLKRSNANTNAAAKELGLKAATVATGVGFRPPPPPAPLPPPPGTARQIHKAATTGVARRVAPPGLMPPGNARGVTPGNAAGAAFAVIPMSCYDSARVADEEVAHVAGEAEEEAMEAAAPPELFAQ